MSEIEHFTGKLTPTGKTIHEYMSDIEVPSDYDKRGFFNDELRDVAFEISGEVFSVDRAVADEYSDIFKSTKNADGTINFHVKYYNGGCCFGEALEYALGNKK